MCCEAAGAVQHGMIHVSCEQHAVCAYGCRGWQCLALLDFTPHARSRQTTSCSFLQVARVGLYDRNRALKAVRRKAVQALTQKSPEELTEEEIIIAQRAKEIREAAAAKSIQRTKEELAQEAMGVPRSYARAEALPEGLWEELKMKYR